MPPSAVSASEFYLSLFCKSEASVLRHGPGVERDSRLRNEMLHEEILVNKITTKSEVLVCRTAWLAPETVTEGPR